MSMLRILLCLFIGTPTFAHTRRLRDHREFPLGAQYVAPNEQHPDLILPQIANRQPGALISVGTERGLMTVLLASPTLLVQVDNDAGVVRYNQINRELLKSATSAKDYRYLRFQASSKIWSERIPSLAADDHDWWRLILERDALAFFEFHRKKPINENGMLCFTNAHYLYNEGLFQKLHRFALEGQIEIRKADISNDSEMRELIKDVRTRGPISLLDISNAWAPNFAGSGVATRLTTTLKEFDPNALFVGTYECQINPNSLKKEWCYVALKAGDQNTAQIFDTHYEAHRKATDDLQRRLQLETMRQLNEARAKKVPPAACDKKLTGGMGEMDF